MDMSRYILAPLQLDKICRACLGERGVMKSLYGACLDDMLVSVAQIRVSEGDGLPSQMCVQCILQCSRAYTFKQQCEKSEYILRNFISPEFQAQLHKEVITKQEPEEKSNQQEIELNNEDEVDSNINDVNQVDPSLNEVNQDLNEVEDSINDVEPHVSEVTEEELQHFSNSMTNVVIEEGLPAQLVTFADGSTGFYMENVTIVDSGLNDQGEHTLQEVSILQSHGDNFYNDDTYASNELDLKIIDPSLAESDKSGLFACTKCPETFNMKVELRMHMMTHPKALDHECPVCNKSFAEARILKRHSKIHLDKKPHQCDQCEMSFAESSNLSKHKKKHTGELRNIKGKPHLCSVCGRAFKWASSLSKHMKYHTGHKLHTCQYCRKQYVEARSLKIHLRSHTGERPHVCPVCDKGFTQICNLEKHLRVHTGEKPYVCNVCGKGFTQSGYMSVHMRTHTGERPYMCHTCGKSFAGSNTLAIHQRIHTGEKPFLCNICGKPFSRLKVHQRLHGLDTFIACKECGRCYSAAEQLQEHMIDAHDYLLETNLTSKVETVEISDLLTGETVHSVQVQTLH